MTPRSSKWYGRSGRLRTSVLPASTPSFIYRHLSRRERRPNPAPPARRRFVRRKWLRGADLPVLVVARNEHGRQAEQAVSDFDLQLIDQATKDPRQKEIPSLVIDEDREMYSRSGLGKAGYDTNGGLLLPAKCHRPS